ncbi:Peroxidase 64 [Striga hermonthica]|uniref:peroxidase n=1 Tax=Striga hermonthica TaxID=68872 RepID=A0A9N7NBY2_STRHE|nr:Peroxidase 64 [Striga hermonthica]
MAAALLISLVCIIVLSSNFHSSNAKLDVHYYQETCPLAEFTVTEAVKQAMSSEKTVAAALLRMHFHDCFIRGCDASVLLNSKEKNQAEKDGPPNISLHAFYVIDNAKQAIEKMCPGVVSCADILALAARDAVTLSGGPTWDVLKGRKDGRISNALDTRQLPAPTFNISQLQQNFLQRGLSMDDLVALSGGHTLGFAHCSSFKKRLYNFSDTTDVDPSLDTSFAAQLRQACPLHNTNPNAGAVLDSSPLAFDNAYYKMILQGKSIFSSDQALLTDSGTRALVMKFASSQDEFYKAFAKSMIKMSSISGGGGEIRLDCKRRLVIARSATHCRSPPVRHPSPPSVYQLLSTTNHTAAEQETLLTTTLWPPMNAYCSGLVVGELGHPDMVDDGGVVTVTGDIALVAAGRGARQEMNGLEIQEIFIFL